MNPHTRAPQYSPDAPVFVSDGHDVLDLFDGLADERRQVLDVGARVRPLLQLETLVLVLVQQVPDASNPPTIVSISSMDRQQSANLC